MSKEQLGYKLLLGACKVVGCLPPRVLYVTLSPFIYLILYHIAHYRRAIVRKNLVNSFPEKTSEELACIERKYYHHLSDLFVDTIKLATMTKKQITSRFVFDNLEVLPDRDFISAMAHYGSWELSVSFGLTPERDTVAVYRPLHNKAFDLYYNHIRCRFGAGVVPMQNVLREIITHRKKADANPLAVAMIADQTPAYTEQKHWHTFLNQETSFFGGLEKLAVKFRMPIYFSNITKVKRGHYICHFEPIFDGDEQVGEGEITRRYVEKLEQMIRRQPELWVWSHRRWKHKKRN